MDPWGRYRYACKTVYHLWLVCPPLLSECPSRFFNNLMVHIFTHTEMYTNGWYRICIICKTVIEINL
jgi:hypothetical protein